MKKFLLTALFLTTTFTSGWAFYYSADYAFSSNTNQARVGMYSHLSENTIAGAEYGYYYIQSNTTAPKKAHSLYVPFIFKTGYGDLKIKPFYYHEPKIKKEAYGIATGFESILNDGGTNDASAKAYLNVSGATSKDITVNLEDGTSEKKDFNQITYTLGVKTNHYDSFFLDISLDVYQYLSGVSKVRTHNLFVDQKDLGNLKTIAPVVNLPKYSPALEFSRLLEDQTNKIILSYAMLKFHDIKTNHSFIIGNSLKVKRNTYFEIYYNYLTRDLYDTKNYLKIGVKRTF